MTHITRVSVVALAVVILTAWPCRAEAQEAPPAAPPVRQGFVIGFSTGIAGVSCRGCATKGALDLGFRLGWMATPRLALLLDAVSASFSDHGAQHAHGVGTAALQYFVTESVWMKVGVGEAVLTARGYSNLESVGWQVGVGTTLRQRGRYAMDVSAGFASGRHPGRPINNLSVRLGFNWY